MVIREELDFNQRFAAHVQGYPEGTEDALRQLEHRSALLSIEGIAKVLDILNRPRIAEVQDAQAS